jgi:streptomycin 6-kinase
LLPFDIPAAFLAHADRGEDWAAWFDGLPALVRVILDEWGLTLDGSAMHGECSLVLPVRTTGGRPAVAKFVWPHDEAEHESLALQHWHGKGAVELLRADPRRWVLLLERAHAGEDLTGLWDLEACEVVAGLYRDLHRPAVPQLRTLSSYISRWTDGLAEMRKDAPVPRRLVDQALSLGRSFVADQATDGTMIHADLHYENVLAADREPWLAIDPKPMSGDPHYEIAPLLWNRWDEVVGSGNARHAVRRRFHTVVDAAELDEDRARHWVVVREMHNAMWTINEAGDGLTERDRDWLTRCITIAKAVQE